MIGSGNVVVLGSGIVGLWTAHILSRKGYRVTVVAQSDPTQTTSAAAAAVLVPMFPGDPESEVFQRCGRWAVETLEYMKLLPVAGELLEVMPCFEFGSSGRIEYGFPIDHLKYVERVQASVAPIEPSIFGCDLSVGFDCNFVNAKGFLNWLHQELVESGVSFRRRRLESNTEVLGLGADIVFNCLGYNHVFSDPELYPVFGQAFAVPGDGSAARFVLGAGDHAVFSHAKGFHIGAFFEIGNGDMAPRRDLEQRSQSFVRGPFRELCRAVGVSPPDIPLHLARPATAGIRPFRRSGGPRLAIEQIGNVTVVHNYGHGAHGWTIGYGSSRHAVELVGLA